MKILIHRYNSICEPDYIEAFERLGLEVAQDRAEMTDKNLPLESRIQTLGEMILTEQPLFVFSINFFPYISMVCEKLGVIYVCVSVDCPVVELFSVQIRNKCNRVFLFDYEQFLDVKDENPDCIFYMPLGVNTDRIDTTIGAPDCTYKYDVSFVGSLYNEKNPYPKLYGKLEPRYRGMCDGLLKAQEMFNGQELLEQAIPWELVGAIREKETERFPDDTLNFRSTEAFTAVNDFLSRELAVRDRVKLLSLAAAGLKDSRKLHVFTRSDSTELIKTYHKLIGDSSRDALTPPKNSRNGSSDLLVINGGVRTMDEMPLVFRQSRINLNHTIRSIRTGLPQRVWDILGSGGFLLTNYQAEIPEYFEIGTHLDAYETVQEACEKINYYLGHDDERMEIARNGYMLVKEKHKITDRVVNILRTVLKEY